MVFNDKGNVKMKGNPLQIMAEIHELLLVIAKNMEENTGIPGVEVIANICEQAALEYVDPVGFRNSNDRAYLNLSDAEKKEFDEFARKFKESLNENDQ